MNSPTVPGAAHPFETLTPDVVLDALESVGLRGDGRLTALSSYENRVYQVQLEDGAPVVAKFYRPERWSDAQIQEEHDFAAELMAAEIPAVGPLVLNGQTLHRFQDFSFSVSPRRGGRPPELDDGEVLEWIGRFLARIHTVGAHAARLCNALHWVSRPLRWSRCSGCSRTTACHWMCKPSGASAARKLLI